MKIKERLERTKLQMQLLHGVQEETGTPPDVVNDMCDEFPEDIIREYVFSDAHCGRGPFLAEIAYRKYCLLETDDELENQKILECIIGNEIYGNDISKTFQAMATSSLQRAMGKLSKVNIDNKDAEVYNLNMEEKIELASVTNPPYQPAIGVKKGGNEYKKHILKDLKRAPKFGVANIPMTFMVQDPFDADNLKFRNKLLDAGLKKIKHIRPDAYKANVLTVYIVWQEGYTGDVEFSTYDIQNVNVHHSISVSRDKLRNLGVWPVARTVEEFDSALKVLSYKKKKYTTIKNKVTEKADWCVEFEYLIGMEKERLNKMNPLRGIAKRGPTDKVRGGSLSKFINVQDENEADSLVEFLSTVGQEWFRSIPRGSSAENWMVGPLVEMWKDLYAKSAEHDIYDTIFDRVKEVVHG